MTKVAIMAAWLSKRSPQLVSLFTLVVAGRAAYGAAAMLANTGYAIRICVSGQGWAQTSLNCGVLALIWNSVYAALTGFLAITLVSAAIGLWRLRPEARKAYGFAFATVVVLALPHWWSHLAEYAGYIVYALSTPLAGEYSSTVWFNSSPLIPPTDVLLGLMFAELMRLTGRLPDRKM